MGLPERQRMNSRAIWAATLTVVAVGLLAVEVMSWSQSARLGPVTLPGSHCTPLIDSVGEADRASGLRAGDRLLLPRMDPAARLATSYRHLPVQTGRAGETIQLSIERGGQQLTLPYLLRHVDSPLTFVAQLIFKLFILAVGLFVLWRGRDRASLFLGIWSLGIAVALPDAWWGALSVNGRLLGGILSAALWTYSPLPLYLVIESITQNVSRRAMLLTRTAVVLTTAPAFFVNTIDAATQVGTGCAILALPQGPVNAGQFLTQIAMLGFFILSYAKSTGLARQRVRWVFWAFLISRFGVFVNLINRLLVHPIHLSGVEWLTVMIFPLGCAYAILRHRIIDVNFVLNRTIVYTILTTLAVGVFILVESGLNVIAAGRGVSLAVELGVALALGFSFNVLLKKIEGFIERTLFRRKYKAAQILAHLSEEAAFMENADSLLERATSEIPRAVGASGAAVYERVDDGYRLVACSGRDALPQAVDVDDQAFVRLRRNLSDVDLSDVSSALRSGGMAFALAVRGRLFGALVCCERTDDETYAPDEIKMLCGVAHEIGAELHAIRARQHAELLDELMSGSIDLKTARARLEEGGSPAVG